MGGGWYIWHANEFEFEKALRNCQTKPRQILIWAKNTFTLGRADYQWQHEPCFYGFKEGKAHYFCDDRTLSTVIGEIQDLIKGYKNKTKDELIEIIDKWLEIPTTILNFDKPKKNDLHPTMKPVELCEKLIRNSTKQGEIVLDIFGGSGSTLIACEISNRICKTMELDPIYCQAIIDRYKELRPNEKIYKITDKGKEEV